MAVSNKNSKQIYLFHLCMVKCNVCEMHFFPHMFHIYISRDVWLLLIFKFKETGPATVEMQVKGWPR
jgi:hypothetical protein